MRTPVQSRRRDSSLLHQSRWSLSPSPHQALAQSICNTPSVLSLSPSPKTIRVGDVSVRLEPGKDSYGRMRPFPSAFSTNYPVSPTCTTLPSSQVDSEPSPGRVRIQRIMSAIRGKKSAIPLGPEIRLVDTRYALDPDPFKMSLPVDSVIPAPIDLSPGLPSPVDDDSEASDDTGPTPRSAAHERTLAKLVGKSPPASQEVSFETPPIQRDNVTVRQHTAQSADPPKPDTRPPPTSCPDVRDEAAQSAVTSTQTPERQPRSRQVSRAFQKMINKAKPKGNKVERETIKQKVAQWDGQPPAVDMSFIVTQELSPRLAALKTQEPLENMIGNWVPVPRQDSDDTIESAMVITPCASAESVPAIRDRAITASRRRGMISESPVLFTPTTLVESPSAIQSILRSTPCPVQKETPQNDSKATPDSRLDSHLYFGISESRQRPRVPSNTSSRQRTRVPTGVSVPSSSTSRQPSRRLILSPPSEPVPIIAKEFDFQTPRAAPPMPKTPKFRTASFYRIKYADNRF